ncbi:MAG: hypothetical protein Q8919_09160, partial [Bacteroidota bacterium]|nr:hypothetical protein [Bacteroidota bacterium]
VMESLIKDGYLPTETIIVLQTGAKNIVKEGNRRIACLKLIHGIHKPSNFDLPSSVLESIATLGDKWFEDNEEVGCSIFSLSEADVADRIVTLAHGKGEKASRDPWPSVARARHNRDQRNVAEPGLDLLEKYLKFGQNITGHQRETWAGDYKLSVLDEAMSKIYKNLGFTSSAEIAANYPKISNLHEVESILLDIGLDLIDFTKIRNPKLDFATSYGLKAIPPSVTGASRVATSPSGAARSGNTAKTPGAKPGGTTGNVGSKVAVAARAIADPLHVKRTLENFTPRGLNRQKVVSIRDEMKSIKLDKHPIAFCLLLRTVFEISAKAYCHDHSIGSKVVDKNGKRREKTLREQLKEVTSHLTKNKTNTEATRLLHGAYMELAKPDGILSITTLNQLVHSPSFALSSTDICIMFGNIFPLLEQMN